MLSFQMKSLILLCFAFGLNIISLQAQAKINFTDAFNGTTFNKPVYFAPFPGKLKTYVVLEQQGKVTIVSQKNGIWVKSVMFQMNVNSQWEMGLLGIAFHPNFVNNRKYYIYYNPPSTVTVDPITLVGDFHDILEERIADSTLLKDSGLPGRILIDIPDKYRNHNGGTIGFGPKDGFLYFGMGDGGYFNDPDGNAQNKNVLLGKMLRIDVDKKDPGLPYGIPPTNPFAISDGRKEVYAYGLRNPWKWSFDSETGSLWAGDVGQGTMEEIDTISLGGNYGWKAMEGTGGINNGSMILPLFAYGRTAGICIIGGFVYRANKNSPYYGTYFFGDNGTAATGGKVWYLKKNSAGIFVAQDIGAPPAQPSSFGMDETGRIYMCGHDDGTIYLLDSQDLLGGAVVSSLADLTPIPHRRIIHLSAGHNLQTENFGNSALLNIFTLEGKGMGQVSLKNGTGKLPQAISAGIYLVREGKGETDLMIVK